MSDNEHITSKVLRKRKGWQGEELEMAHHREKFRESTNEGCSTRSNPVAVDLKQFQNHKVGEGYQAKHFVRQRGVSDTEVKVIDMSLKTTQAERTSSSNSDDLLKRYLQCKGLREFRMQLDEILKA
jgi:hypothetical protein